MLVKAFVCPPMASNSLAIWYAERLRVPLKIMCSMKWDSPFSASVSSRAPAFTQTPMETERVCGM
jgi:hypothetical protein